MEYVIAILLIIIIYYLYKGNQQKEAQAGSTQTNAHQKSTNRPAFSEAEYNKVWSDFVTSQSDLDVATGKAFNPAYPGPWLPPGYEECKDDIQYLEKLYIMTKGNKKELAELKSKGAV